MTDAESALNLKSDESDVAAFLEERGGKLIPDESDNGMYWLLLRPSSDQSQEYVACVRWDRYPQRPPSIKFADAIKGSLANARAWPSIPGYRPGSFDICMPFTAEGFALHAEWNSGPQSWRTSGNPFLWVASRLQDDLNSVRYSGRVA